MLNPLVMEAYLAKEDYVLLLTEHEYPGDFLNLITGARMLAFFTPVQRLTFLRSLPNGYDYPPSLILPSPKPAVGNQSKSTTVVGILAQDGLDLTHLLNMERALLSAQDYDQSYSFVLFTHDASQYDVMLSNADIPPKPKSDNMRIKVVNLMDASTYSELSTYPSLLFTFDQLSSSPFVYALQASLQTPVMYIGDNAFKATETPEALGQSSSTISSLFEKIDITLNSPLYQNPFASMLYGY